jgi:ribosomal protein S18 acetylase RimI-like enzyme
MIIVRRISDAEYYQFRELMIEDYAQCMVSNYQLELGTMRQQGKDLLDRALPDGQHTDGCIFYTVLGAHTNENMRFIYCSTYRRRLRGEINHIIVKEPFRGKGFGEEMLTRIESGMKASGMERLGLHVFADNSIAIRLYQRHGYQVADMNMHKWL